MDQPAAFSRTLLADRLVQGVRHEARRHRRQDAPADDPAGEDINDKGHMDHPRPGRHAGEVRHPELVLGAVAVNSRLTLSSGVIRGHPGRPAPDQGPDQGSWFCFCRA